MASSNKTEHFQLNQWVGTDPFRMADFNEDNAKIDAALAAAPRIAMGSYTGNGVAERKIKLDFTPKAVLAFTTDGQAYARISGSDYCYGGLALQGKPCYYSDLDSKIVSVETGGFKVYFNDTYNILSNENGVTMYYIAFG